MKFFIDTANLEEIKRFVREEGFDPILAAEFDIEELDIHHHSLLLLHLCSKAVFEVTFPAGQLMELERCRDYNIKPLLVRNTMQDQDPLVSQMIRTMADEEVNAYSSIDELRELIRGYLQS